uniref:ROK family protein n=1 Tax=Thaumasiovibrio occultus TaxID=1891184 RepID=UPI000B36297C|nr:ROK family protein [Thaumasiovibrio occultus]
MRIGFDIGGTKIETRVLNQQGAEMFRARVATPHDYDTFIQTIAAQVKEAEQAVGVSCSIGIGLPGAVCPHTQLMKNANCTFLNGHDLLADLARELGKAVYIDNDANCFALSEARDGAGKGGNVVFGAVLGTGCGGALVVNQQLITGRNAIAGEWGHNPLPGYTPEIDGPARACYCGRENCIETFISGTGFSKGFNQRFGTSLTTPQLIAQAEEGQINAVHAYRLLVDQVARSVASIINVVDPDTFVIGGGLSNIPGLIEAVEKETYRYVFSPEAKISVKQAQYGDASGVRGAAWLAPSPQPSTETR